ARTSTNGGWRPLIPAICGCSTPQAAAASPHGAVNGRGDRLERGRGDRGVDPHTPDDLPAHFALHIGGSGGVPAFGECVFGVVEHGNLHPELGQCLGEGRDRPVTAGLHGVLLTVVHDRGGEDVAAAVPGRGDLSAFQLEPAPGGEPVVGGGRQVLVGEDLPDPFGAHLPAIGVGVALHDPGELDLQPPRQVQVPGGAQQVGHTALAGLGVDPDHRLVVAAHVLGVHRQVGHVPRHGGLVSAGGGDLLLPQGEALLDRGLVRAGESGVHQVPAVGVPRVYVHLGAVHHRATDLVDVGEVDHRIHTLGVQVHAQGDQVHVAGALPLSEQAPFHPVGAGHHGQFRGCHGGAAVVVRVHREGDVLAAGQVAAHPFDLVGVHVGGGALDGGGQIQHDLTALLRAPDVHHRLAD